MRQLNAWLSSTMDWQDHKSRTCIYLFQLYLIHLQLLC